MALKSRPDYIPLPEASAFPPELVALPNWVAYKLAWRDGGWTKVPVNPRTGKNAKTNDPTTWATFGEARAFAVRKGIGLGVMLAPPLFGFDLDHCITDGELSSLAQSVLGELYTYAETSISGSGVKGIGYGMKPTSRCRRNGLALEIYSERRLFALTGLRLPDAPLAVNDCQEGLDFIHGAAFGSEPVAEAVAWDPAAVTGDDDQAVIDWLHNYRHGGDFARQWRGEDVGDPSAGDQGLANRIAWRVGPDPARIEVIFNLSARALRDKWQRRADYRERTIRKAIERCNGRFYEARAVSSVPAMPPQCDQTAAGAALDPALSEYLAMSHEELARRAWRAERRAERAQRSISSILAARRNNAIKAERDTLVACVMDIRAQQANGQADAEGWVRQSAKSLAATVGKGEGVVGDHRKRAQDWGLLELKLVEERDPQTGARRTPIYVRTKGTPDEVLDALVTLVPDRGDKKDWGGKREPCPICKSQRRVKTIACADCGHEFSRKIEEPPADTPLPGRGELLTDEAGNVAPTPIETLADPGATYPQAAEADENGPVYVSEHADGEPADDWDPSECNAPDCWRRIDPTLGRRYCWQHQHLGLASVSPPIAATPQRFRTLDDDLVREYARRNTLAAIDERLERYRARWAEGDDSEEVRALLADWRAIRAARVAYEAARLQAVGAD